MPRLLERWICRLLQHGQHIDTAALTKEKKRRVGQPLDLSKS
jgi:hypothetical protein